MEDGVNISIIVNNPSISELHDTISSILSQNALKKINVHVSIINQTNLIITSEVNRLKKNNINVSTNPPKLRFVINLTSGDILSKSFLYKATYYLKQNHISFVCPEYTFKRLDNSLIIATICNHGLLSNVVSGKLVDLQKDPLTEYYSPKATIIPNSCLVTTTIDVDFKYYYRHLKEASSFFNESLFLPKNVRQDTPTHIKQPHSRSSRAAKLCGNSKTSKTLLNIIANRPSLNEIFKNCPPVYINPQTKAEFSFLSSIKLSLNGYENMKFHDVTSIKSKYSQELYYCYQLVAQHLSSNQYDYIMVAPWLIPGGIDLFSINYLKTIAKLRPKYHILIILTNDFYQSLSPQELDFPNNVELVNLPDIIHSQPLYQKYSIDLLYSIINVLCPKRLHIIASKVGYDCLIKYNDRIHHQTAILFSSYNYLVGENGEYLGYHVQELPRAYRPGDIVTTDNQIAKNFLINNYGFLEKDILVHRQLLEPSGIITQNTKTDEINILWAAHVRPEKNPEILPQIAKELAKDHINITCYGLFDPNNWEKGKNPLKTNLKNLSYLGPYQNFFKDINLSKFDLFLYTSHTDGTPNVILEAAIAGLPIVSSNIGGIHDVVGDQAVLINDTNSVNEFILGIKKVLSNKTESHQNALILQSKLTKLYNKDNFTNQVKDMLKRSAKNV